MIVYDNMVVTASMLIFRFLMSWYWSIKCQLLDSCHFDELLHLIQTSIDMFFLRFRRSDMYFGRTNSEALTASKPYALRICSNTITIATQRASSILYTVHVLRQAGGVKTALQTNHLCP